MTASFLLAGFAGTQTLRVRQSSLPPASRKVISPKTLPCRQWKPKSVALRTPDHFAAGAGAFQRRSPTGGAAYGIPRNACTGPSALPSTSPEAVFTCGALDAAWRADGIASVTHSSDVQRMLEFISSPVNVPASDYENSGLYRKARPDVCSQLLANPSSKIYNQRDDFRAGS